jgi:hypothetical protein
MILDSTDFVDRPYKVPNQEESRDFISFIEEKEEELLRMILGDELYDEFAAGLETSGTVEQIWTDLKGEEGVSYEYSGKNYTYKGLKDLLKPGVFSEWMPLSTYKFTNIGFIENNAPQQSKLIDDQYAFQVDYWNKFVSKVGYSYPYGYNCKNTFYGFMKAHSSDYPSWVFKCPRYKNRYDL